MPEREMLRRAVALIRERLPRDWSIDAVRQPAVGGAGPDAVMELVAPDQTRVILVLEGKRSVVTRDLPGLLEQMDVRA